MRGAVTVHIASASDVTAMAKFTEDVDGSSRPRPESPADREDRFEALLAEPRRVILVAGEEQIDGLLIATQEEVGALHPVPTMSVTTLLVDPSHRRRGVGRALLAELVHIAESCGVDSIVASVSGGDRDANRYLARLGFAPMVVRRIAPTNTLRRTLGIADASPLPGRRRRGRARLPRRGFSAPADSR